MSEIVRGAAWKFGNDISTDVLSPGAFAVDPVEIRKLHCLEAVDPRFAGEVQPGDIVVAGTNFGCGSSRETAAENLKELGVACVVADSLSRLFMRNAVAVGLPVLVCPGAHDALIAGEEIEIDLASGTVTASRSIAGGAANLQAKPLPEEMRRILARGGILAALRELAPK